MLKITFQPVMNGIKRTAEPREKVNGYNHTQKDNVHLYRRGNIAYIVDTTTEEVTIQKFDYSTSEYKNISYEEAHKFINIIIDIPKAN